MRCSSVPIRRRARPSCRRSSAISAAASAASASIRAGVGIAPLGVGLGAQQEQLAADQRIGRAELERAGRVALRLVDRTDVERPLRGGEQQPDRLVADVRRHARHRADLADEFGRRRGVVGDLVDRRIRHVGHHRGRSRVALGAHQLRQRLVRDLAHDIAAEPPGAAVLVVGHVEESVVDECSMSAGSSSWPSSMAKCCNDLTAPDVPRTDALSSTARGPGASRSSREAMSARSEPGSVGAVGIDARQRGELGEEQRVAAAALVELVGERTVVAVAEHRLDEHVRLVARQADRAASGW